MVFRQGACCYSAAVAVVILSAHGDSIELFPVRADPCCAASFVCCMVRSIETMLSAMAPCMWCFAVLRRLQLVELTVLSEHGSYHVRSSAVRSSEKWQHHYE